MADDPRASTASAVSGTTDIPNDDDLTASVSAATRNVRLLEAATGGQDHSAVPIVALLVQPRLPASVHVAWAVGSAHRPHRLAQRDTAASVNASQVTCRARAGIGGPRWRYRLAYL